MNIKKFSEPYLKMQWVSDFGMTLELYSEDRNGEINQSPDYPLLKILADDSDEKQYLQFNCNGQMIRLPVKEVKDMIYQAEKEVHSETWYDKNMFSDDENS